MRICLNRQQSPCKSSTSIPKPQTHPYFQSLSGSIKGPQYLLQSNQSNQFESQSIQYFNLKQALKTPINDSILIQDKQNCYISNKPTSSAPTSRNQTKKCENHDKDKAEYYLMSEGGELFQYCNKCAAALISQGFKVDRITQKNFNPPNNAPLTHSIPQSHSNSKSSRKQELNQIWQFFQKIYEEALNKKNITDNFIFTSQGFFNEQIQQINQYFNQLHNYLEILKNRFYNTILHEKQLIIKTSQQWSGILSQVLTQIESIQSDIRINQQGVIELQNKQYQQFIQILSGHLKQYFNIANSWKIESLTPKKFVGVPVEEIEQVIRNMMMGGSKTPRTSLIRDRVENGKTMGKSSSCMFAENKSLFQRKYSVIGPGNRDNE